MALLCAPYLLDPGPASVHVVWHTTAPGSTHAVLLGPAVPQLTEEAARSAALGEPPTGPGWRRVLAVTTPLSRMREDEESVVPGRSYPGVTPRPVYRQLARADGLPAGRTPYRVVSVFDEGRAEVSAAYSLRGAAPAGQPVRLLLSSDHQLGKLVPANLAAVAEAAGVELDGVLLAGDMVNVADRPSDWFDHGSGRAFFATFAGSARWTAAGRTYRGAPILPHTPLFPAIGNHEVMRGRLGEESLWSQFNDARPDDWSITSYEELFPVPRSVDGGSRWWSRTVGDVQIIALFGATIWRPDEPGVRGTFSEAPADLDHPERWGHGRFIFEPIGRGSAQYAWLERELAASTARYRVVMFHHPAHGLGWNSTPAYTDPVPVVTRDQETGAIRAVRYGYPLAADYILSQLSPLFAEYSVHLVLNGHSHLWNRFRDPAGVNWLETSNVGNTWGVYDRITGRSRRLPDGPDYVRQGDPGGLTPITPTIAPLTGDNGQPLPFVASDDITTFSILDSPDGVVRSYRFDTRDPAAGVVLFDEFTLASGGSILGASAV